MWLRCHTAEEIGQAVGLAERQSRDEVSAISSDLKKTVKVHTAEEIGQAVGLDRKQADREVMDILEHLPKSPKLNPVMRRGERRR